MSFEIDVGDFIQMYMYRDKRSLDNGFRWRCYLMSES